MGLFRTWRYIHRDGNNPALNVIDNLIAQKKIPVMICVFINPGDVTDAPNTPTYRFVQAYADQWHRTLKDSMRSTEYDTVSDRYARFCATSFSPQVTAQYNIRKDAYSRAITGLSSVASARSTQPGRCPINSAASLAGSAASPASSGKRSGEFRTGVRIILKRSCASRRAISAYGYRTAPTIRRTIVMAAGRWLDPHGQRP